MRRGLRAPNREALNPEELEVEEAYRLLVERYWKLVVVLVRQRLRSERDAEDVAQEAFIRAFRALDKLESPRHFLGWLLRIAQNLATDLIRRRRSESSLDAVGSDCIVDLRRSSSHDAGSVEARLERDEDFERVLAAIPRLPEAYQQVLVLRYLEGLSNVEIARHLEEPEGTIRNRLFRALHRIREVLDATNAVRPES